MSDKLYRHLLDMLGAKNHEDAGRIIGELHARPLPAAKPDAKCSHCGAPCKKEVLMRGGDHGWGDDDSRTMLRYSPPPIPQFPTMLRKMWSGGEVQDWLNRYYGKIE